MRFGLTTFATDRSVDPATMARIAEERGYDCVLFPEHTHIPASRRTAYPGSGEMPAGYERLYDPIVAMTAAAAATSTVKVGTAVVLVAQHDPIVLAKQVACVDHVSGGRVELGIGGGWNVEEMEEHGVDPKRRFARVKEHVEAMRAIWTQDEATFEGEHVRFERAWCWPKPVQDPYPPILVGGDGPRVLERVLAYGDEWLPNATRDGDDDLLTRAGELRRRAADAGRAVRVTVNFAPVRAERLHRYAEAGVERCVFFVPSDTPEAVEQRLERLDRARAEAGVDDSAVTVSRRRT